MAEQEQKHRRWRWDIIIAAVIVLIAVQAVNTVIKSKSDRKFNTEIEKARDEIAVLGNDLKQRADEIKKLGGNITDLEVAIQELEEEKKNLVTRGEYTAIQMTSLRDRVEGYRELLVMKDEEIAKLKTINEVLVTENSSLKTTANELNAALSQEQLNRKELESKVVVAQRLKAENIKIMAVNSSGKIRENEFKARFINKVRVEFNIGDNPIAPIEGKEIMIRIVDPNNNPLFDLAKGGGTIMLDGREEFTTLGQQILFDNTQQKLTFEYEKGSEFETGRYVVLIYTDDYLMGEHPFLIK
jgi:cell division protein ZapB